jgi:hypothetical protein
MICDCMLRPMLGSKGTTTLEMPYQRGGGSWDEYCSLCGLPFYGLDDIENNNSNSNNSNSHIHIDADTAWLDNAIGYCLNTRVPMQLSDYDGSGVMSTKEDDEFHIANSSDDMFAEEDHYGYAFHKDCVKVYESTGARITVENSKEINDGCYEENNSYQDQYFRWAKAYKKKGAQYFASPLVSASTRRRVLTCASKMKPRVRNIPSGSTNVISYDEIEDGDKMVNFHGEYDYGRYYKRSTFNAMPRKINPMTTEPVRKRNIVDYTAHIVPAGARRSSRRSRSPSRGGGRRRSTRRQRR